MGDSVFQLALLLTLKDEASSGLDRFRAKLLAADKDGHKLGQTLDGIRGDMAKDFAVSASAFSVLGLMGKGIQVAGDFQASMTELRSTFSQVGADGKINMAALGVDMQKAEALATRMGNQLPGTTEDYVRSLQRLRQQGVSAKDIFGGVGEAVANLAVATNAVPEAVAKDFGQFVNLFRISGSDAVKAADTMSRLYTSTGVDSSELIAGMKYFQGRSGASLGLTGIEDAEKVTRLMGLLKKQGMEGSLAGTALNNMFSGFSSAKLRKDGPLDALRENEGIDLKLFDTKGAFIGIDKLFQALEPLQKLTEEKRTDYLKGIFGEEGMSVATAILKTGAKGWTDYNAGLDKTISLAQKNAEMSKNFNNQLEALTGSLKNLVVTGFTPLLPKVTAAAEKANAFVGSIAAFAKLHPDITSFLAKFALIGTASIAVGAGLKGVYNGLRLLSFVSKFSSEEKVTSFLSKLRDNASSAGSAVTGTANAVDAAEKKISGSAGRLERISKNPIVLSLQMVAAGMTIEHFISLLGEVADRSAKLAQNAKAANDAYDALVGQGKLYGAPGEYGGNTTGLDESNSLAGSVTETMKMGRSLEFALAPDRAGVFEHFWTSQRPYTSALSTKPGDRFGMPFNADVAAQRWKDAGIVTKMQDPNVLARIISQLQESFKLLPEGNEALIRALEKVTSKEKVDTALQILKGEKIGATATDRPMSNQSFSQIQDIRTPWNIKPFDINRPMGNQPIFNPVITPFQPRTGQSIDQQPKQPTTQPAVDFKSVQPLDLTKLFDTVKSAEVFNQLTQPVASNVTNFTNLAQPTSTNVQNFTSLQEPTANVGQSFGNLLDPANRMPGSFSRINTSVGNVAGSLDSLSTAIASWRPPAVPGIAGAVPGMPGVPSVAGTSNAKGGFVSSSGIGYIHFDEEIVPARTRSFRDTLGQNLTQSLVNLKQLSADDRSPISELATITSNNRTNDPGPNATGLFPDLARITPTTSPVGGGNTAVSQPVTVNVNQGAINITLKDGGEKEIARLEKILAQHQAETGRIAVAAVERAMQNGRVRS